MEKDTLLETLKSNSMTLSLAEIQGIMDEELNKNPDEMDTELIDLCADVLDKAYSAVEESTAPQKKIQNNAKSKKRIKFNKVILAAAIIVIALSIAIPVSARFFHKEAGDNIVAYDNKNNEFQDNLLNGQHNAVKHSDPNNDLIKELKDKGLDDIILPSYFLNQDYTRTVNKQNDDDLFLDMQIDFKMENGFKGYIGISKHKTKVTEDLIGQGAMGSHMDCVKQITVNGMDVLIYYPSSSENEVFIIYVDNNVEYSIDIANCDLDTGIEIVKTLE